MSGTDHIMIIDLDDGLGDSIREVGGLDAENCRSVSTDNIDDVMAAMGKARPLISFFCVPGDNRDMLALIERAAATYPKMGVAVAASTDSPELILSLLRAGADEFFTIPCDGEAFRAAMRRVCRKKGIMQQAPSSGPGKIIAVFSGKGGCGTTMIASNLAGDIAKKTKLPVAVVDFDLQFGDIATMMDVQSPHTMSEAIGTDGSIDLDLIEQIAIAHTSGASVIAGPRDPAEAEGITGAHVTAILEKLREKHSFVIVDTSCAFNECSLAALDAADEILLVTDALVPSIRAAQRSIQVFDQLEYDRDKIHLIVNRFDTKGDLTEDELGKAFELPIFHIVPNDFDTAMSAIDAGVSMEDISDRCELTSSLKALSLKFLDGEVATKAAEKSGMFGKLTQMFNRR